MTTESDPASHKYLWISEPLSTVGMEKVSLNCPIRFVLSAEPRYACPVAGVEVRSTILVANICMIICDLFSSLGNNKHRPFCNALYVPKMWRSCFHHHNSMRGVPRDRANQTEEDSDSSCASWSVLGWCAAVCYADHSSFHEAVRHLPVKCGFLCQLQVSKLYKDVLLWRSYLKNKAD